MRSQSGYSFVELLIVSAILFILASAVMPLAQVVSQRQRESELRSSLRQMRPRPCRAVAISIRAPTSGRAA